MRNLIVVSLVALVVAVGMAFAVGLVEVSTVRSEGKCVMTVTVNTSMVRTPVNGPHLGDDESSHGSSQNATDVNGKITAVRPEKGELVVSENIKDWTFQLAKDSKVSLNGRECKLAELQAGDDATVTFDRQGPLMVASVVRAKRK